MSALPTTPIVTEPAPQLADVSPIKPAKQIPNMDSFSLEGGNINPLAARCNILLALLAYVSHEKPTTDAKTLVSDVSRALAQLEHELASLDDYDSMTKKSVHYCLCVMADAVLAAQGMNESEHQSVSFLEKYYAVRSEQRGIYAVAQRLLNKPQQYREVLELIYLCLNLGFDLLQDGRDELFAEKRLSVINKIQDAFVDHWQDNPGLQAVAMHHVLDKPYRIKINLPIWPIYALTPLALICVYWLFNRDLNERLAIVLEQLQSFN